MNKNSFNEYKNKINNNEEFDTSNEEWLDGADVLQLLHISPRTLQNYRDKGILGFSPIGRKKIFYRKSEILKLLKNNYVKPLKN